MKHETNAESFRARTQLFTQDTVRIEISRRDVNAFHRLRISSCDLFERPKEIVRETARCGEDTNRSAGRQTRRELRFDLLHENLQAVINRAMKRVFQEDAIEWSIIFVVAIVNDAHHAGGVAFLQEQAAQLREEERRLTPGAAEPFRQEITREVTVIDRFAANSFVCEIGRAERRV